MTDKSNETPAASSSEGQGDAQGADAGTGAYKPASPGDPILAQDWNGMQLAIRKHITTHTHSGEPDKGMKLTGEAIDGESTLSIKALSTKQLRVRVGEQAPLEISDDGVARLHGAHRFTRANAFFREPVAAWSGDEEMGRAIMQFGRFQGREDGVFYETGLLNDRSFRIRKVRIDSPDNVHVRDRLMIHDNGRVEINELPVFTGSKHIPRQWGVRVVHGGVTAGGSPFRSAGFNSRMFEEGRYEISFNEHFVEPPTVVVTPQGYDGDSKNGSGNFTNNTTAWIAAVSRTGFFCVTGNSPSSSSPGRRRFHFIAIGFDLLDS